jgi:Lysyl oxidase
MASAARPVAALLALIATIVAILVLPGASPGAGEPRLPDLDQLPPSRLVITRAGPAKRPTYRLGFRSAVSNVGAGPLVIVGRRPSAASPTMVADQLVDGDPGTPPQTVPGVGDFRYVVSPDHRHWHLLGFDTYSLRRAGSDVPAVTDRKTGFCLGDRYRTLRPPPAAPPKYTSRCGLGDPGLIGITEGISVGYGDDYAATLEGQYLPLSGLGAGSYVLVHRANARRRLRESDYANNAASLLLRLRLRDGRPSMRVLRVCPDTDRCDD